MRGCSRTFFEGEEHIKQKGCDILPGLGTVVNTAAIIAGGILGLIFGKLINEKVGETVTKSIGFSVIVMSIGSIMSYMLKINIYREGEVIKGVVDTQGTLMMIISLGLGAFIGEVIDIDRKFEQFGTWLKNKTGNEGDMGFTDAFVCASLTVCVGAMAIIGALQDGINGDHNTLYAKAVLDFIIIVIMTSSMGKGCVFSAIPVFVLQGMVTLMAGYISPFMTEEALNNIGLTGNVLIMCVGVNLVKDKTIRVANMLPAVVIAFVFALF